MSQVNVARVPTKFSAVEIPLPVVNGTDIEKEQREKEREREREREK